MSQNSRNPVNDGQGNSGRSTGENPRSDERKRFEGFEGMNYEQRRGPYNPQRNGGCDRGDINGENSLGKRRDDL